MKPSNVSLVLDCFAAGYRLDLGEAEYVQGLVDSTVPLLDRGLGIVAYAYDARDPARPVIGIMAMSSRFDPAWLPPFYEAVEKADLDRGRSDHPTGFDMWSGLVCAQVSAVPKMRPFLPHFAHFGGARDVFAMNALDASGLGLWLGAPWPRVVKESAARVALFERLAAHLTAAIRLRRIATPERRSPSAVLTTAGALLDAKDDASVMEARLDLRRAAIAFGHHRSREARRDVELTTRRWKPLVRSRWSLLDDFDSDGKRFVVAVDNPPPTLASQKDLSERERQVMTHAYLGHSNKVIAYELGLSDSTVRVLMHRAAQKLGARNRAEAIARFGELARREQA